MKMSLTAVLSSADDKPPLKITLLKITLLKIMLIGRAGGVKLNISAQSGDLNLGGI